MFTGEGGINHHVKEERGKMKVAKTVKGRKDGEGESGEGKGTDEGNACGMIGR